VVHDDDLKAALEAEARQARVPADEILHRIRQTKVRPGHPSLWQRLRIGEVVEVMAVCLILAVFVLSVEHRSRVPIRDGTGADAAIVMNLTSVMSVATVQPGQTAQLPTGRIYVTLQFPRRIDPSSIRIRVEPASWHMQPSGVPGETNSYSFVIRPDAGVTGRVTILVDSVKAMDGTELLREPAVFQMETAPVIVERAAAPEPLARLIQSADHVTVETVGMIGSRTEFAGGERDWLAQGAQSAVANSETDLGSGIGFMEKYRLEIETGGTTFVVMWQDSRRFTVTWKEDGHQKAAAFDQRDERLASAISEVLSARQRGESLR
jgi:hypothetical protein